MKKLLSILIVLACLVPITAAPITEHRLSMNLGGPLSLCSFEYEHEFIKSDKIAFSFTAGVGSLLLGYTTPIGFLYTYGNRNQLLLGVQYVPLYAMHTHTFLGDFLPTDATSQLIHTFSPRLGLRKIFKFNKEMTYIQVFLSPVLLFEDSGVLAAGGIGFGVYL